MPARGKDSGRKSCDKSHQVHLRRIGRTYYVDYIHEGRRIRKSLKTDDRKAAELERADLEYKLRARLLRLPTDKRLGDFIDEYLKFLEPRLAHKNYQAQANYLRRFAAHAGASAGSPNGLSLSQIERSAIESFLLGLNGGKPSPRTWNNMRGYILTMLQYAKDRGYVLENVAEKVERRREIQRSIRFIRSMNEIDRLIRLFEGNPLQDMVATLVFAGLRRSEACWLRREDVDLEARLLHVREKRVDGEAWHPKTKRNRAVPISSRLVPFLKGRLEGESKIPWLFPSPKGMRWNPDNVTHRFEKVVRAAGLRWTLLDLRHTFASHLALKGVSLYKIAKLLGNTPQICERHYAALLPEGLHEEVEF